MADRLYRESTMTEEDIIKRTEDAEQLERELKEAFQGQGLEQLPWTRCAMCRFDFKGHGQNAWPILDGRVCDECNLAVMKQRKRNIVRSRE